MITIKNMYALVLCATALFVVDALAKKPQKFFIVIHENADFSAVLQQPFYNQLAQEGTLFSNYYAVTHPSLPNYIAIVAGSTFGITSDDPVDLAFPSLANQLDAAGISWKLYIENWPGMCFTGTYADVYYCTEGCIPCTTIYAGPELSTYRRAHNPFINFIYVSGNSALCNSHLVDASEFYTDVVNGTVPDFAIYIPNAVNDAHDTDAVTQAGLSYSDRMLRYLFTLALSNDCFKKDRVFAVTFDESFLDQPNHVYTAFVGENVKKRNIVSQDYSHYDLLRTVQENFNLGTLPQQSPTARPMTDWQK